MRGGCVLCSRAETGYTLWSSFRLAREADHLVRLQQPTTPVQIVQTQAERRPRDQPVACAIESANRIRQVNTPAICYRHCSNARAVQSLVSTLQRPTVSTAQHSTGASETGLHAVQQHPV
jgi:hypothetical protein